MSRHSILYIHPTKGWRGAAVPRKTNRRRKPIPFARRYADKVKVQR